MGYHVVDPADVEPLPRDTAEFRSIGRAIELETLGLNLVEVEPGEQIPLHYHSHERQEEAFYVVEGVLHVETPEETFVVPEGQFFVVEPENPHRAHNPESADDSATVLAVGAPSVDDVRRYEP